jgi:MFS family permease
LVLFGLALFAAAARGPISGDLMTLYAAFRYHLSPAGIGFMASGASAVLLPLSFLSGWAMDHWGRKKLVVPDSFGLGVVGIDMAASAAFHPSFPIYVTLFLLAVGALGLTSGSIQTVGADLAPPEARGMFLGLWRFAGQTGTAGGPVLFVFLADRTGYGSSFVMLAIAAGLAGYLMLARVPEAVRSAVQVLQQSAPPAIVDPAPPPALGAEAGD